MTLNGQEWDQMMRRLEFAAEEARAVERERCAKIAECFIPTGPSPIGPLYGAGIHGAAVAIAKRIRSGEGTVQETAAKIRSGE
jgi:hypothetical protein